MSLFVTLGTTREGALSTPLAGRPQFGSPSATYRPNITPPPFGGGPYFLDASLRPRLVLG